MKGIRKWYLILNQIKFNGSVKNCTENEPLIFSDIIKTTITRLIERCFVIYQVSILWTYIITFLCVKFKHDMDVH